MKYLDISNINVAAGTGYFAGKSIQLTQISVDIGYISSENPVMQRRNGAVPDLNWRNALEFRAARKGN
jgi:hypothetical protein